MVHGIEACRRRIEQAESSARNAKTEADRRTYLKIATNWRELIRYIEKPAQL